MKKFKAIKANGLPIITVISETEGEAKVAIRKQLRRPGRFDLLEAWSIGGFRIKEEEHITLRHITYSDAEDYCQRESGMTLVEKLEQIQQDWLDKLEETVMAEIEIKAIDKAKTDAGIISDIPKPGDKIEVTEVVEIPPDRRKKVKLTRAQMQQRILDWIEGIKEDQRKIDTGLKFKPSTPSDDIIDSLYRFVIVPASDRIDGARTFKFLFDGMLYEYIEHHRSDGIYKAYGEAFDALTEGTNWEQESERPGVEYFVEVK